MVRSPAPEPKRVRMEDHQVATATASDATPAATDKLYQYRFDAEVLETVHVTRILHKPKFVMLTGRSVNKEIRFRDLSTSHQTLMRKAMGAEWEKWMQFDAVKFVSRVD